MLNNKLIYNVLLFFFLTYRYVFLTYKLVKVLYKLVSYPNYFYGRLIFLLVSLGYLLVFY